MARAKNEPVVHSVTSASSSTTDDQDKRVKRYLTMMGIRVALLRARLRHARAGCAGRPSSPPSLIPYVAVVIANAVRPREPGSIQSVTPQDDTQRLEQ